MDNGDKKQDKANITAEAQDPMQRTIPSYRLYAADGEPMLDQWVHCEPIAVRSSRHRWHIKPHDHAELFQILFVRAGRVTAEIAGDVSAPRLPVIITMPPRVAHGYKFARSVDGHIITISAGRLERLLAICDGARALLAEPRTIPLGHDGDLNATVAAAIDAIATECATIDRWQSQRIESLLLGLLITLCRALANEFGAGHSAGTTATDRRALAFRSAVDRHFRAHRPLAAYAKALATSETHLNRICRKAFGTSAFGVIQRRIMLEATRDLRFTRHPVAAIAHSLGFDDPAYFARVFKKHTGLTPREFRNRG